MGSLDPGIFKRLFILSDKALFMFWLINVEDFKIDLLPNEPEPGRQSGVNYVRLRSLSDLLYLQL